MTFIRLDRVTKYYGDTMALDGVELSIGKGELFFLLGPSGCGKSTLLRLIAGLLTPSAGRIFFDERDVTAVATQKRNAVMCFQGYALWPHMTVRENIRFGLSVRKMPPAAREKRVDAMLALIHMDGELESRTPSQLSGGQQQRVALARALAVEPDCLLLDEPLSNLDANLRQEMRREIQGICKQLGITSVYVTHDQKEALGAADRIAVLKDGRLLQVGTPTEIYGAPATAFVADFIGRTNLVAGDIIASKGGSTIIATPVGAIVAAVARAAGPVMISIRPERIRIVPAGATAGVNRIAATSLENSFLGESTEHVVTAGTQVLRIVAAPPRFDVKGDVAIEFDPADVVVLDR